MLYITGSLINLKIKLKTHGTVNLSLLGEVLLYLAISGTHNNFSVHKYTLNRHTHGRNKRARATRSQSDAIHTSKHSVRFSIYNVRYTVQRK